VARERTCAQQLALHGIAMAKESANRKRENRPETAVTQKEGKNMWLFPIFDVMVTYKAQKNYVHFLMGSGLVL
jgi:hypothetical protein